jgi:hypothetical protein
MLSGNTVPGAANAANLKEADFQEEPQKKVEQLPQANTLHIPTPNRYDRRIQFGIDGAESVHFTHWEPGGEHIKQLIVKNVVMKTQKIRYKLPKTRFAVIYTRYFSLEFPETQTLSAGMSL